MVRLEMKAGKRWQACLATNDLSATYPILRDAEVANVEERGATLLKIFRMLFQV